jgi:hypothetical protein
LVEGGGRCRLCRLCRLVEDWWRCLVETLDLSVMGLVGVLVGRL